MTQIGAFFISHDSHLFPVVREHLSVHPGAFRSVWSVSRCVSHILLPRLMVHLFHRKYYTPFSVPFIPSPLRNGIKPFAIARSLHLLPQHTFLSRPKGPPRFVSQRPGGDHWERTKRKKEHYTIKGKGRYANYNDVSRISLERSPTIALQITQVLSS